MKPASSCQISCVDQRGLKSGCVKVCEGDASLSPAADHSRLQHHEDRPDAPDSETFCCPN